MNDQIVENPEIGNTIRCGAISTNYHDVGSDQHDVGPVLLLHGSGPGVSAWANWRLPIQFLKPNFRLIAPDLVGFGYSQPPADITYGRETWLNQIVEFLDALKLEKVNVIGNSFGGSMALALAISHPERINKLVLMGSVGVNFELTAGLDAVWGYEPSVTNMKNLMRIFAYDHSLITDDLAQMRYEASIRPGVQESFSSMFPAPRQRWVEAMAHSEADIRAIPHPALLVHGRDDKVIPLSTSLTLHQWIDNSQLHVFGQCGHWTQIERGAEFSQLVSHFLSGSS